MRQTDFFDEATKLAERLGLPNNLMLDPAQLGKVLGKGVSTIHYYRRRHPNYLPPALHSGAYARWYLPNVLAWMVGVTDQSVDPPSEIPPPRRGGRPTKAEVVARRSAAGGV